jgi:hypothetical protein
VRHAHLMPLEAVVGTASGWRLRYGEAAACPPGCHGIPGAVAAVHDAGLWVGDVKASLLLDAAGRVVLGGIGGSWDLADPFAGHPSTRGVSDLRIAWRQQGDELQLRALPEVWRECPGAHPPDRASWAMERLSG